MRPPLRQGSLSIQVLAPSVISLLLSIFPSAFKYTKLQLKVQFWLGFFGSVEKLLCALKKSFRLFIRSISFISTAVVCRGVQWEISSTTHEGWVPLRSHSWYTYTGLTQQNLPLQKYDMSASLRDYGVDKPQWYKFHCMMLHQTVRKGVSLAGWQE